jgi:hypothetical protein
MITDEEVERIAKKLAESMNGGKFYDENFYRSEHRAAWMRGVRLVIEELGDECS